MAIISVRLNTKEERIVSFLSDQLEKEKSALIKYSIQELYENFIDKKIIDEFEKNSAKRKLKFVTASEILKSIK